MTPLPVRPVLRICSVAAADPAWRVAAIDALSNQWHRPAVISADIPFDPTGYYREEMGDDLVQQLIGFDALIPPDGLPDWKLQTNRMETDLGSTFRSDRSRPVNLDCGYITEAKFVLATTKNRSHRIYLRDGIFAEITLTYIAGRWQSNRQTYPNYRTEAVAEFAVRCRKHLREGLQSMAAN